MKITYLLRSVRYVWQHGRWWVISSALFSLLIGLQPIANLWVMKEVINAVTDLFLGKSGSYDTVVTLLLLQFALLSAGALLTSLKLWLDKRMEVKLEHDLRHTLFEKVASVSLDQFERPRFYHHLSRINNGLGSRFLEPVKDFFEIIQLAIGLGSFVAFLFTMHWSFVLISLLAAGPTLFVHLKFGSQRFRLHLQQTPRAREAGYMAQLLTDRQAAKEIRLFGLIRYLIGRWSNRYQANASETLRLMGRQQGLTVLLEALSALFYLGAALIMISLMRTRALQVGDFVSMGQAIQGAQNSINRLSMKLGGLHEKSLYIRDYFQFLEMETGSQNTAPFAKNEPASQPFPPALTDGIRFENVSFHYPDIPRNTLQNVSFHIRPGEKIAVVGENGSGKTTLVKCLMGLYPTQQGHILFDGIPLEAIAEQERYKQITVLFQDFMKYALTVRENIAFGDIERLDDYDRLHRVAAQTAVDQLAAGLKNGYDTPLGRTLFDGEDLSGGQWQRIAIARALFRNGQIIILDEPTAALDPRTEMEVFHHFRRLTANKTAIFISHRMAAARMADRIIVMKNGRVEEVGTHDELYAREGEYHRMYSMQAQWYAEKEVAAAQETQP